MNYPISEIFESVQGEGTWTGTSMAFVRLAGCNVGKPYNVHERSRLGLEPWQERCTAWDGTVFSCDTNYRRALTLSGYEIAREPVVAEARHVCVTGGEPLIHKLEELVHLVPGRVHLETSGTVMLSDTLRCDSILHDPLWVTVSPKAGYLEEMLILADEIKVLIGSPPDFDRKRFVKAFEPYFRKVWVQPVNGLGSVNMDNANLCMELRETYRLAGVSVQLHKILNVR